MINYFPQAFLVWQHAYNNGASESGIKKSDPSSKHVTIKQVKGKYVPKTAVSKMFGRIHGQAYDKNILNLENHKISALVPEIRLFRAKNNKYVPFYFPVAADYGLNGGSLLNTSSRSFSAGAAVIESFTITNTKKNAYSFRVKSITANLRIKVDNIAVLLDDPPSEQFAPLMELFTFTEKSPSQGQGALASGEHPRCAVTLGYSVPPGDLYTPQERRALERAKIMAILSYTTHDFSIEPDGSATVSIQYVGFLQEVKNEEVYDALVPVRSKVVKEKAKSKKTKQVKALLYGTENEEKSPEEQKKEEEQRKFARMIQPQEEASRIIGQLYSNNKIHSIDFNSSYFEKKSQETAPDPGQESTKKKAPPPINDIDSLEKDFKANKIYYFAFADLLDAWMDKIIKDIDESIRVIKAANPKADVKKKMKEKEDIKRSVTILMTGFAVSKNVAKPKKSAEKKSPSLIEGNIADIPISLDTFYTVFYDHTVNLGKVSMDLQYFLEKFCSQLLNKAMDEFTGSQADIIAPVSFDFITFPGQKIKKKKGPLKMEDFPDPSRFLANYKKNTNYYIFQQGGTDQDQPAGSGNKQHDLKSGIYHLHPNKDRGMVKAISFSMKGPAGMRDWNITRDGHASAELRLPHNATVEMYANSLFLPGSYLYIDPDTLGFGSPKGLNSAARRLGLGGYYVVGDITTTYSGDGTMNTVLNLTFDGFPTNASQPTMSESRKRSIEDLRRLRES